MIISYKNYKPTRFDSAGLNLPDQQDWLVCPTMHNRDSDILDESNFNAALEILGGESDSVEVHRFNHWACGWFEIILVEPGRLSDLERIEEMLEECTILDEGDYYTRQSEEAGRTWDRLSIERRVEICQNSHISIYASRRDELPEGVNIDWLVGD